MSAKRRSPGPPLRSITPKVRSSVPVMIEHDRAISRGRLTAFGPKRARISTNDVLRANERLVLTVTVPEASREKTQAVFRLCGRVRSENRRASLLDHGQHNYVLQLVSDGENLENAGKLFSRFQTRGIVET